MVRLGINGRCLCRIGEGGIGFVRHRLRINEKYMDHMLYRLGREVYTPVGAAGSQ